METTENQEVVVTEEVTTEETPTVTEPDLSEVEVISNGQHLDLTTSEDNKADDKAAEEETKVATPTPEDIQKEVAEAKATTEQVKQLITDKGLNFEALQSTYDETGTLTEAQYQELEQAGYPKAAVDACIAGLQATADKFVATVKGYAGSEENFNQMAAFVATQGEAQVSAFNNIMTTADLPVIKEYMAGIQAQMIAKNGTSNASVLGSANSGVTTGFADTSEMTKAMADPRYGRDAKYTKTVEAKVAASNIFG
ncbi:hypothetical protein [uncultured Phascolarctobacterium sp.]|jgi:hypothetical protein|uniref:capsid assembly protein n=1 Tax=uncultured Phascolarctobacterium sp. TaxID=512296 RepID=UPI0025DBBEDC|nr:hypothetical protein [uncultured Phascolarctobacterium sp.]